MNRNYIATAAMVVVIMAAVLYSYCGNARGDSASEHESDTPVGTKGDSPPLPNMEFNITINQSQSDNLTQDTAAEYNAPTPNRESLFTIGVLALLDLVIIVTLIGAIMKRRSP